MINKKAKGYYVLTVMGAALFIAGIVSAILFEESQGIMKTLPFMGVGIGAGFLGGGLGGAISNRRMLKNPELAKKAEVESKDERNILISYKAKAAAYNIALLIFAALVMFLALVQVEAYITLIFVGAYLLIIFLSVYFSAKYRKEM